MGATPMVEFRRRAVLSAVRGTGDAPGARPWRCDAPTGNRSPRWRRSTPGVRVQAGRANPQLLRSVCRFPPAKGMAHPTPKAGPERAERLLAAFDLRRDQHG